jgi:predicted RNase H-like HicB family nuclease
MKHRKDRNKDRQASNYSYCPAARDFALNNLHAILACMKRRSEQLNIRVTSQERSALEAAARKQGFRGLADYLRAVAFSGKIPAEHTYTVLIHPADADEGGFWAEVPALPGCNSQGETYEQTIEHTRQAIEGYLRMLVKLGKPIPSEKQPKSTTITAVKVAV